MISILLALLGLASSAQNSRPTAALVQRQLQEANARFTYRGKPINPLAVQELLTWLSDTLPGPVAVDIEGTYDSNRYFGEYSVEKDGRVTIQVKDTKVNPTEDDKGSFSYKRLGTLANGIHVLETLDNGGGSGTFGTLLLVKFVVDDEYDVDGKKRNRLVMMRAGEISLGDRYAGRISVGPHEIQIGADRGSGAGRKVLRFD